MAWYNDLLGTGANIFGAGTSMDVDRYKKAGLLDEDGADMEKAQSQSLTRGLLGTAIGYLAQPKNQNYGSAIPYLAKGFQQGMKQAQEPFTNLQNNATQNAKLDTMIADKTKKGEYEKSIDTFIASHPEYGNILKNMPTEQAGEIIRDFYKPKTPNLGDVNKEKTVMAMKAEIMGQNPEMGEAEAEGKARIKITMKPAMTSTINTGETLDKAIQMGSRAMVDNQLKDITTEADLRHKMDYASELVELAGDEQGFGSDFKQKSMNFFEYVGKQTGINIVPAGSGRQHFIRALKSAQVELALGSKKPGTGPMTDNDFKELLNSTVQIGNPLITNRIISYVKRKRGEARQQYARDLMAYVEEEGYGDHVRKFQFDWDDKYRTQMKEEMMAEVRTMGKGGILQYQRDRMKDRRAGGSKHKGRQFDVFKNYEGEMTEAYYANGDKLPQEVFNQWKAQFEGKE